MVNHAPATVLEDEHVGRCEMRGCVAARLEAHDGGWEHATMLHAQAESILDELGLVLYEDDQRVSDVMLERAHHALGDARYGAARQAGRSMDVPRAGAMADQILDRMAAG